MTTQSGNDEIEDPTLDYASFYHEALAMGFQIEHHESDLYVLSSPEVKSLAQKWKQAGQTFISQVDGRAWIEYPFQYSPTWEKRALATHYVELTQLKLELQNAYPKLTFSIESDAQNRIVLSFEHEGTSYHDPLASDCGRFEIDPVVTFGMSQEHAQALSKLNENAPEDPAPRHAATSRPKP